MRYAEDHAELLETIRKLRREDNLTDTVTAALDAFVETYFPGAIERLESGRTDGDRGSRR